MTFSPFFPWCCDQELTTCNICDRPVPTCLRVTVYDCENDYEYGNCDCRTFNGTYFLRGVQHVSRLYLRDPASYCGQNYFETQNACVWWGYVCNPIKRCGPEPCERYDRVALILGELIGGYDYGSLGYFMWVVFYDSTDAPHGLPGQPSRRDMLGTQLVIDGAWQFNETETGIICDNFTQSCGGQGETSCIAGGGHCIDLSTCRFACRVRIQAIECDQAVLACNSFPCESCCRGIRPNAVTVTLLNPPTELACLEGWPHDVPLVYNPDYTKPCVYKGEFLCDANYGYDKDGHIEVTVTRNANRGVIDINAYFRGARYQKTVDEACDSLTLIDLDYVSGKVDGDIDVSGTKLRIEANAGGAAITPDWFVGVCDQECQPHQLLVTITGFPNEYSVFNGDYIYQAGYSYYEYYRNAYGCRMYGFYAEAPTRLSENERLAAIDGHIFNHTADGTAHIRFLCWAGNPPIAVVYVALFYLSSLPWDCSNLDVTIQSHRVYKLVGPDGWRFDLNWNITMRIRLVS